MIVCGVQVTALVGTSPTFIQLVQTLYDAQFTGPYVVHTLHGCPQMVEFTREKVNIVLDTRRRAAVELTP